MNAIAFGILFFAMGGNAAFSSESAQRELQRIDAAFEGNLGVYWKDLETGTTVAYQADRPWYLSSTVKVPIAVALLRKVDRGEATLDDLYKLAETDKVDGMGASNLQAAGTMLRVGDLLEGMIAHSDSTAADILLRLVGEKELNDFLQESVPSAFGRITTILQVRSDAYSELHPRARSLPNQAFFTIKQAKGEAQKLQALARLLQVPRQAMRLASVEAAFELYYRRGFNSATLTGFGQFLEKLARGQLLSAGQTAHLLAIMERTHTGGARIKAGLPAGARFAHKTGTQVARICNMGLVLKGQLPDRALVVAACAEKFKSRLGAERALQDVGEVIKQDFMRHSISHPPAVVAK